MFIQAFVRNAVCQEFSKTTSASKVPYIDVDDQDIERFLPPLPIVPSPISNAFCSLADFAERDPTRYRLYCNGLVAEGYEAPVGGTPGAGSSSEPTSHRRSKHKSGCVYTQDLDWNADWAKVNPTSLDIATLPDPVAAAKAKLTDPSAAGRKPRPSGSRPDQNATPMAPEGNAVTPQAAPVPPEKATTLSTPNVEQSVTPEAPPPPGSRARPPYLPNWTVPPRTSATRVNTEDSSSMAEPMAIDTHLTAQVTGLSSQESEHRVLVPSSSQIPPLDPDHMDTDQDHDDRLPLPPPSLPLPDVVPNTFPEEPTQPPPPLPRPKLYKTVVRTLVRPMSEEHSCFDRLLESVNGDRVGALFDTLLHAAEEDPDLGLKKTPESELGEDSDSDDLVVTEPQGDADKRQALFWAMVRDRRGDLIPDEIFPYLRDDHPAVRAGVQWTDFVESLGGESASDAFDGAGSRFSDRNKDNHALVFDTDKEADVFAAFVLNRRKDFLTARTSGPAQEMEGRTSGKIMSALTLICLTPIQTQVPPRRAV